MGFFNHDYFLCMGKWSIYVLLIQNHKNIPFSNMNYINKCETIRGGNRKTNEMGPFLMIFTILPQFQLLIPN